jgi:hypothetical protein
MKVEVHSENKIVLCTKEELYGMFLNYFGGDFNNFELEDADIEHFRDIENKQTFSVRFFLGKNLQKHKIS